MLENEKQAKADMKALLDKHRVGESPITTTLREMGKHYRLANTQGKKDAIKVLARLIVKHRFLYALPMPQLIAILEESVGIKK